MKHGDNILGKFSDVEPLTQQLETILNETLLFTKDIYGPLFSKVSKIDTYFVNIVIIAKAYCFCIILSQ